MNNRQFLFSVIIPIYNVEKYLAETIESVINQSIGFKKNIELILVNDGSPDNSEQICLEYKEKYPDKSIWAFSGYLFDKDILAGRLGPWEITKEYLSYLDVLVDGPFVEEKKNLNLRFRGSENQRLIDVPASLQAGKVILWEDKGMQK